MVDGALPSFGSSLRRFRVAAGLTQEQLAEQAGLSARGISDLERGVNRMPRRDTLGLLMDALALSADDRATLAAAARHRGPPAPR
ncbi:MAG TPA: helix-turn-helix transcriptional regulator, partial [Thermomicrobiales bacterium]|nr:helix-turn-helix transcriptional regulator [Thermomicrobiales bacterium]